MFQEKFAAHCGIHRVHMGKIERGSVGPSICLLGRIAEGLSMTISNLLDGVESYRNRAASKTEMSEGTSL